VIDTKIILCTLALVESLVCTSALLVPVVRSRRATATRRVVQLSHPKSSYSLLESTARLLLQLQQQTSGVEQFVTVVTSGSVSFFTDSVSYSLCLCIYSFLFNETRPIPRFLFTKPTLRTSDHQG
jgi:hypothetical protein